MVSQPPIDELHFSDAPRVDTSIPGPASERLLDRQERLDSNAVAYPKSIPIAIDEAKGATLKDADGNLFLDFFGGIGVLNVGHSNPYVLDGVKDQLDRVVHTVDFPTEARLDLIEKLDEIAPGALAGNNKVVFGGPTGSDAVEATIKLAKHVTGGDGLVAFRGAYHGGSSGALSLTAGKKYKESYTPLLADVYHLPYPHPTQSPFSSDGTGFDAEAELENVRNLLEDPYSGLANPAGIWVEAIQGEGGVVTPPEGFLRGLKAIAADNDVPLIVDEIQTGFGRTGEWFASEWEGVTPDILPMAKAISGSGQPLSATMYRDEYDTWGPGAHVGTYRGNVPAMVGGVRAIEYVQDQDLLAHARETGSYIRERLRGVAEDVSQVRDVRGRGLFIGVEFEDSADGPAKDLVSAIQTHCYERGVLVWTAGRRGEVLRLIPPLVLTRAQAETGTDVVVDAIETVCQGETDR